MSLHSIHYWCFTLVLLLCYVLTLSSAQPLNDACTGAINVSRVPFRDTLNTTGAISDSDSCGIITESDIGVWYLYQNSKNSSVIINVDFLRDTTFDAELSVFTGSGCNDLNCIDLPSRTELSWLAEANVNYYLLVSGARASTGRFTMNIEEIPKPSNDECINAQKVVVDDSGRFSQLGSTSGATPDFAELTCNTINAAIRGVWYEYTSNEDRILQISITGASNTFTQFRVQIFTGNTCETIGCAEYFDYRRSGRLLRFAVDKTLKYYILVTGFTAFDQVGTFTFSVEEEDVPPNDRCVNATVIDFRRSGFFVTTAGALIEEEFGLSTCGVAEESRGLWYTYTAPKDMNITLQTSAGDFFHRIAVFEGKSCNPAPSCRINSGFGFSSVSATVTFTAFEAEQYYFLVSGRNLFEHEGTCTLRMTTDADFSPSPPPIVAPQQAPTERPSFRPVTVPSVAPVTPPSPVAPPAPTRNPNISQPTSSPMTVTVQPVKLPQIAPTKIPTKRPTMPPGEVTPRPAQVPVAPPVNIPTTTPTDSTTTPMDLPTSRPSRTPVVPPRELPTKTPTRIPSLPPTILPTKMPFTAPQARPDPAKSPTRSPTSRPTVLPTKMPNTNPPTNLPTSAPTLLIDGPVQSPSIIPTDPMRPVRPDLGKGKGTLHYVDDYYYSGKGKGGYHYNSGKGKGGMHSRNGMMMGMKYYHAGKGKGYGMYFHHRDPDTDTDDDNGSNNGKNDNRDDDDDVDNDGGDAGQGGSTQQMKSLYVSIMDYLANRSRSHQA